MKNSNLHKAIGFQKKEHQWFILRSPLSINNIKQKIDFWHIKINLYFTWNSLKL